MIAIKIHESYRKVVALCDANLVGRKFEEGKRQLFLRENFYKEKEVDKQTAVTIMERQAVEDATFNIAGEESIKAAIEAGIIKKENVAHIENIPFSMTFL